ncbi:MAG: hypothetical protein IPO21_21270 [Bacteroidales bacterium]|nr:hypothetical protein [Bacteroidales bacterium]
MRKIFGKVILLIFVFVLGFSAFSQDCLSYHKSCRDAAAPNEYSFSDVSRSGLFLKGQSAEFVFDLYQGKDYRLTMCSDEVFGTKVQFKIIDYDYGDVLYNNADFNFAKEFEFTVLQSRKIKLEVNVPSDEKTQQTTAVGIKPKPTQMGCIGVLVEFMVTPRKGF